MGEINVYVYVDMYVYMVVYTYICIWELWHFMVITCVIGLFADRRYICIYIHIYICVLKLIKLGKS